MAGDEAQEALEALDRAVARDPQNAIAWFGRGAALSVLERYQEAVGSCDKALDIQSRELDVLARRSRRPGSAELYQESEKFRHEILAGSWALRGYALHKLERYQEAVENCEEALILAPTEWTAKDDALDEIDKWLNKRRPINLFLEPYRLVAVSEKILHRFIKRRLIEALGESEDAWRAKGVPETIRVECVNMREKDPRRHPPYSYTYLIDLKGILDKNWRRCFEDDFQKVKGLVKSKKEFLDSLDRLNEIRNTVMHPVRDIPTDADHEFARQMLKVKRDFVGR